MIAPKNSAKILLLEDDKWLAESFANSLRQKFDVLTVADPAEVFGRMKTFWPDAIVADVLLGAQNLFVLLNEMQSYDDSRKIPIIILSSVASQIHEADVREFGVKKVLDKATITPQKLRAAVASVLDSGGADE